MALRQAFAVSRRARERIGGSPYKVSSSLKPAAQSHRWLLDVIGGKTCVTSLRVSVPTYEPAPRDQDVSATSRLTVWDRIPRTHATQGCPITRAQQAGKGFSPDSQSGEVVWFVWQLANVSGRSRCDDLTWRDGKGYRRSRDEPSARLGRRFAGKPPASPGGRLFPSGARIRAA
jgi:hypothetical protein